MGRGGRQRFKSRNKCNSSESKSHDDDDDDHDHAKKQKSNSKSCKVISKLLLLPEDIMLGIFNRVPLKWLLNSARYVCKPWATIIGSSHFAEMHLQSARAKPGLYVESLMSESNSYFLDIKDNVNGQFERTDLGTPPRMGHIISTCDGILLLWAGHRRSFVVNPILKCWLRIPLLPIAQVYVPDFIQGYNRFTIARVPRTAKFKLFFVDVLKVSSVDWYVFHVLRIGIDNSWKEITRKESPSKQCIVLEPVYSGGSDLYWVTTEGVIVMDVDKEIIVREYLAPPAPVFSAVYFLCMGNHLSFVVREKDVKTIYQIYIFDIDSGKWTLYHEMGPFDYVAVCGHELDVFYVDFDLWINDQIIFGATVCRKFSKDRERIFFCYNVKTRQLTKIDGIVEGSHSKVWLHNNSLVSLPSTPT